MITKVGLKGAEFYAFHGYYPQEQKAGNTFIIDIEVEIKSFDSTDDNINDTINYEELYAICKSEMAVTQKLLETVVLNIIQKIKTNYSNVIKGEVRLEKQAPQMGGKIAKAFVEMKF